MNKIEINIIGQSMNPLKRWDCIAFTIIAIGNIDSILFIDSGKKGSAITSPLPNKIKKTNIKIEIKKVDDLSDNIDIVMKIFPKKRMKIDKYKNNANVSTKLNG